MTLAGDPVASVELGTMPAGDATNDNQVDILDYMALKANFGGGRWCFDCPHRDFRCDFNNNDYIDATDFSLMKSNFGHGGAPPIGP